MDPTARDRILRALGSKSPRPSGRRSPRGGWPILVALAVAAVGFSLVGRRWASQDGGPTPRAVRAHGVTLGGREIRPREGTLERGVIQVRAGGRLTIAFSEARVSVRGPATLELRPAAVALYRGQVEVGGKIAVEGAGCRVAVDGRATIRRFATHLRIVRHRGTSKGDRADKCHTRTDAG